MYVHFGVQDFFLAGNRYNVCRQFLQVCLHMAQMFGFFLQFHTVFVKVCHISGNKLREGFAAFMNKAALFQVPRACIRKNKDFSVFFNVYGGRKRIGKAFFQIGYKLYILAADGETEALHGEVTQYRESCFIKKTDTGRQIVKCLFNGSVIDGFPVFGFTEEYPDIKYDRQHNDNQQHCIRNV